MMRWVLMPLFPLLFGLTMLGRAGWWMLERIEEKCPRETKREKRAKRWRSRHERG